MPDVFGRMVTFLIGVVMLFMIPLTIIMVKQDDTKQALLDDAVVEFVDNARASGEITPTAYRQFVKRINDAHQVCNISITYESSMQTPEKKYSPSGGVSGYGYKRGLQAYTKEDITNFMFYKTDNYGKLVLDASGRPITIEPVDFPLKEGGFLSVRVVNETPTPGTQMLRMFLPRYAGKTLLASYSGYVGNNKQ